MNNVCKVVVVGVCYVLQASLVLAAQEPVPIVDRTVSTPAVSGATETPQPFTLSPATTPRGNITASLNVEQRVYRLEQQITNLLGQNFVAKIDELQHLVQKMNGELEAKTHQLEQLEKQLKDFYQDLNQRVSGAKTKDNNDVGVTAVATSATTKSNKPLVVSAAQPMLPIATNPKEDVFFKEQQAYQMAIDLLPDKKHESESKLREYLKRYPKGVYVVNAHYWLGEINFLQRNFDVAEEEFNLVIKKYAKSKRVADAMLKLALVHHNQGREVQAKQELDKVIKTYPNSPAAQLAKQQLDTLKE